MIACKRVRGGGAEDVSTCRCSTFETGWEALDDDRRGSGDLVVVILEFCV